MISATRVHDGALRVFRTKAVTKDVMLASACLPRLHHAVNIYGEPHWDGGYAANCGLIPLVASSGTANVLVAQLVPTDHAELPVTRSEIENGSGRSSSTQLRLQRISAEEHAEGLSELSALNTDAGFLLHLRDRGRAAADACLTAESDAVDDAVAA